MEISAFVSAICLTVTGAMCVVGVFAQGYDDSLLERLGMSMVGFWCLARVPIKLFGDDGTEPVHLLLHIGLMCFAVGFAVAKYKGRHCNCDDAQHSDTHASAA